MPQPLHLLVGTTKGLFILDTDADRTQWRTRGPYCDGWPINHAVGDQDTGTIWAGGGGDWHGAGVWRSEDLGATWTLTKLTTGQLDAWAAGDPDFAQAIGWDDTPPAFGDLFTQVWSLRRVGGRLYAGTKPARLLVSDDEGRSWDAVKALTDHPDAAQWNPGAAGLTLHTIIADANDPDRIWVGISAAGVFASEDGGATWQARNDLADPAGVGVDDHPAAPRDGQTGLCVHHLERASDGRLYQQNHHGVWRSDDDARTWTDITTGLPSTFGFPVHVHPRDPDAIWTIPLNGDSAGRFPPDAAAAVWCSRDGGRTWTAQRTGLPQQACFFTVLRQSMTGDQQDPAGIYFGSNTGSVFASPNEGSTWAEVARHLPTILSVEAFEPAASQWEQSR